MSIEICHVSKSFGTYKVLQAVDLRVDSGEMVALLGPSGSGKTTLLRIIAGLEGADEGRILFDGHDATHRSARDRKVGFVFQHYALFRHMTVFENIAFGLRVRPRHLRPSKQMIQDRVADLLRLVQLEHFANRYPEQLSGGQRQRIALARALAVEPRMLLLDEPFGALDTKVRRELRRWLKRLHEEIQITTIFVTHDQEEALELADRVVIMNQGQIEQVGTPEEVYQHPINTFVYEFLGNVNFFHGRVHKGEANLGPIRVAIPEQEGMDDVPVVGYVRPHDITVERENHERDAVETVLQKVHFAGPVVRLEITGEDQETIEVELSHEQFQELQAEPGDRVFIRLKKFKLFTKENRDSHSTIHGK
ncbi:sulfate ABC transporter ATP-binding protein [Kroppenstedtia pulmonis]|uniref:Sulfate ABC transporter ATP-binding protein n=1 Tax=Kroppenstedtia pulmonis TaxID=1380685 RepID=A0A7D4C7A4_9BACL|nr:TOBE-like domain-containing protein [Kroppenstedtia pulmonis]QKG84856.1 sulfate ABC transporter ATP-binding protein [Kroppenstedtia pulmonis]